MKTCKTCKQDKTLNHFYYYKRDKTYYSDCKSCHRSKITPQTPHNRKATLLKWYPKDKARNTEKWYARDYVKYALKYGKLIKPRVCSIVQCSNTKIEAHHALGYARENWLAIRWLCKRHHTDTHLKLRERNGL